MTDDLYVRLQKALDGEEHEFAGGHFAGCASEHEAAGFVCDCRFDGFFRRLIERDRKLLARHKSCDGCMPSRLGGMHEHIPSCHRCGALSPCDEVKSAAEFWLTDTERAEPIRSES